MSASSAPRSCPRRISLWPGVALLAASVVPASTPQAWNAFGQEVVKICVAASSLRHPHATGERIDFDDAVGLSALLIAGEYPQPHMKSQRGRELCLFDRRTRTARIADADRLIGPQPAAAVP